MHKLFTNKKELMKTFIAVTAYTLLQVLIFPDLDLLAMLFIAIVLDFATGIAKAIKNKTPRTSKGYRQTIVKFTQYGGAILIGILLASLASKKGFSNVSLIFEFANNGLLIFIIYIECTSILENLNELDDNSPVSKYIFKPLLQLVTFQLDAFKKQVNKITKNDNDEDIK